MPDDEAPWSPQPTALVKPGPEDETVSSTLTRPELAVPAVSRQTARRVTAAVAGNPNCGKTSIFNRLTGMTEGVANYPGVTVERKVGCLVHKGREIAVIDLPGTYSLTAYSLDELVARDCIIESRPDVVVNVLDASNLERNLYLTVQLMEMNAPLVLVLNMADVARRRGLRIDAARLSALLGVPVVETVGNRGLGLTELADAILARADAGPAQHGRPVTYGHEVEAEVDMLAAVIGRDDALSARYPPRWLAVKLIERDAEALKAVRSHAKDPVHIDTSARSAILAIERHYGEAAEAIIAERRYGFAAGAVRDCVQASPESRRDATDRIDALVCHRVLGPLVLLGVVYSLFLAVFKVADEWPWLFGRSPTGWCHWLFEERLAGLVAGLAPGMPLLHSLLRDGLIAGVGGVVSFVPLIAALFLFVAVLEDTGYVARVAFVLDRLLRVVGLQGKSILAMIVSGGLGAGGCAVPGVLATRTLRDEKDRLITMLIVPLMNCGAKMPLYLLMIGAFFVEQRALMLFVLWAVSWGIALSAAWVLRRTIVQGEQTPFVMELPAYHMPTLRGILRHTWERTWMYLRKAGTVILAANLVIWAAMYFPRLKGDASDTSGSANAEAAQIRLQHSVAGRVGRAIEPLTRLAGFEWRDNVALMGGFATKEVVVGTLGTAYSLGDTRGEHGQSLSARLAADPGWSPLRAIAMMLFVMLYAPCSATTAAIRRESGKWRWALFAIAYSTVLAFALAAGVYQVGSALDWGTRP